MENEQQLEMSTRYDAASTETKWYARWEEAGLFQPSDKPGQPKYTITIPPPNITGSLHMGHALCYPLQDMIGRYRRLLGDSVCIVPGQDHAGIATQSVVEKQLRAQGTSGAKLGREEFIKRVWVWREESGNTILGQLKRLGCAFDWSKQRFTLDPKYAEAVLKVFIDWFNRDLIYKGKRVVNWDPVLMTSVSDIETERKIIKGKLYYLRYPFVDGSGDVTIATTRPETMLADVAVAVHPSDARYHGKEGKMLRLPLVGREIPLITDIYPDPEFGSGAVKITPAHDPNDFEVGQRHNLEMPVVIDERGKINENGGAYAGLDRIEARKRIVADLEEQGFLIEAKDYEIPVIVSERSGEIIEPLLSEQWFVRQTELAKPVIEAVKAGKTKFYPDRYNGVFLAWMENIKDWCISRQLWWGHRIPVYYDEAGKAYAALSMEEAQAAAGSNKIVRQDDDVLDTWFSSGLWPFATLGWPEKTDLLAERYPTSVLVTDRNIINLWVARMMMMGIDQMGEIPFHDVKIYATVLTEDGKRMSKSLGTGIDPMGVIETVGADALRYMLFAQTGSNQDLRYSAQRVEESRNFCNKIWNATRFILMNVGGETGKSPSVSSEAATSPVQSFASPGEEPGMDTVGGGGFKMPVRPAEFELVDKWLLSRLAATEKEVREAYDEYDLQRACQALFRFFWSELCDWYIEVCKGRLSDPARKEAPQWVLLSSIDAFLKMLHPIMPHLTEELYSHLPGTSGFLMASSWPMLDASFANPSAEAAVEKAFAVTRSMRALRAELDLAPIVPLKKAFYEGDLGGLEWIVSSQAWVAALESGRASGRSISGTSEGVDLHIPLDEGIDSEKIVARLLKETEKARADIAKISAKFENPSFIERAKPEVVAKDRELLEELKANLAKMEDRLKLFSGST